MTCDDAGKREALDKRCMNMQDVDLQVFISYASPLDALTCNDGWPLPLSDLRLGPQGRKI